MDSPVIDSFQIHPSQTVVSMVCRMRKRMAGDSRGLTSIVRGHAADCLSIGMLLLLSFVHIHSATGRPEGDGVGGVGLQKQQENQHEGGWCMRGGVPEEDPFYVPEQEEHDPAHLEEFHQSYRRWQETPRYHHVEPVDESAAMRRRVRWNAGEGGGDDDAGECPCKSFCEGLCEQEMGLPRKLILFHRGRGNETSFASSDVEDAAALSYLILRDLSLPILCTHAPNSRPCTSRGRLANIRVLRMLQLELSPSIPRAFCSLSAPCNRTESFRVLLMQGRVPPPPSVRCSKTTTKYAACQEPWQVWNHALSEHLSGTKDSWTDRGLFGRLPSSKECPSGVPLSPRKTPGCEWAVTALGRNITFSCVRERLLSSIEKGATKCISQCPVVHRGSPCYIRCFFNALLGNQTMASAAVSPSASRDAIIKTLSDAFRHPDQGGCPLDES